MHVAHKLAVRYDQGMEHATITYYDDGIELDDNDCRDCYAEWGIIVDHEHDDANIGCALEQIR